MNSIYGIKWNIGSVDLVCVFIDMTQFLRMTPNK